MKITLKIFFSWQTSSRTDKLNNKAFILSCIEAAASRVAGKDELKDISFEILQGTGGEAGSPDMIATCLRRNDECHIFIADISVDKKFNKIQRWVNQQPVLRERPNENVMYELGRADGHLEYSQVIHVANTVFGDVSENDYLRPVDIRHKRRPITFCLKANDALEAENVKKDLTEGLRKAIRRSALAALENIYKELRPYENCEQVAKELKFKKKFVFNEHLKGIRRAIEENNGILRILGLNGMGKTRLVLETLLEENTEAPKLYCDCMVATEESIIATTTRIFDEKKAVVLVLDNCNTDLFEKIVKLYQRKNAKNQLYAIWEKPEESTSCEDYNSVIFGYAYEDVVDGIIATLYGKSDEVSNRIKEFASGNPLLAVQAIDGVKKTGDIRDFNNQKLVTNLLTAEIGSEDRTIAETLSLFSSIGYEGDAHQEIIAIAANKNITGLNGDATVLVNKFDSLIRRYLERGLMQKIGVFVRFRSSAISKLLTDEWLERCTATQLEHIILTLGQMGMATELVPPFFDKIGGLDGKGKVMDLLKEMLQPGRLLTRKDFLNTEVGSKIYRSLVEMAPDMVCDSLFKVLGGLGLDELKQIRDGRRELVWTLEKLCYRPETFVKAARLMLRLGCSEVEYVSNNATGQFVSLFPVRLPASSVTLAERLDFLKKEMACAEEKPLLIKALNRALCTTNFIRFGGDVVLARQKYTFYDPRTMAEVVDYITGCLDLVQKEIDGNTEYKEYAIKMLASNFRALNAFGMYDLIMPRVQTMAKTLGYDWDDLLHVLHFALNDDETILCPQHQQEIKKLIDALTKNDFVSRFAQVESYEHNDYLRISDFERTKTVNAKYEALAEEVVSQHLYSKNLLNAIYQAQTFLPQAFATKLASLHTPDEQTQFASDSIDLQEERAHSIFVYYVKEVSEEVFKRVVEMIETKGKSWLLFPLFAIRDYPFEHPYVDKLYELVEKNTVGVGAFLSYWHHLRIDRLASTEATAFLARLLTRPDSFAVVLHMAMPQYLSSSHNNPGLDNLLEGEIIKRADDVSELIMNPHYSQIVRVLLSSEVKEKLAEALTKGIFKHVLLSEQTSLTYEVEIVLQELFEKYFEQAWTVMGSLMSTTNGEENYVKFYFEFGFSTIHNPFPTLIFKKEHLPLLMEWCNAHPDKAYMLMSLAPLTEGEQLSEFVTWLLDNFGNDKMVRMALSDKLGSFAGPVSVYNDRAKLIEPLTKHQNTEVSTWAVLEIEKLKFSGEQSQKFEESLLLPGRLPSHRWTLNED